MYDLTVIGAGWAGINACLSAKQRGKKTCLIECSLLGGVCLNRGCIPTKSLIHCAKLYSLSKKAQIFGIDSPDPGLNFLKVQERKDKVIQGLRRGLETVLKGVDIVNGYARITGPHQVRVGEKHIESKLVLIATGSSPAELDGLKFDGKKVLTSDQMLECRTIADPLLIVGAGVLGCEFASLFANFGSKVTLVEKMPAILPGEDAEVSRKLETIFKKRGIDVRTSFDATALDLNKYQAVLVAVGRSAYYAGLGIDELGLDCDEKGIKVDDGLKTSIDGIYAAGDCTGRLMLAHFASYQGRLAVKSMFEPQFAANASALIPNCIFTEPEVASIGFSEQAAAQKGLDYVSGRFDFRASGMANILDETDGFIKLIWDGKSGKLLGGHIIGPRATELIGILTLALQSSMSISQIRAVIFAHPTLSESISECWQAGG